MLFSSCIAHNKVTAESILGELAATGDETRNTAQFNVVRARVWEGARRGFLRKSYSPKCRISVKFMDDIGRPEGAVDEGGPRREFLQMVTDHLASDSQLFIGKENSKHLNVVTDGMLLINGAHFSVIAECL